MPGSGGASRPAPTGTTRSVQRGSRPCASPLFPRLRAVRSGAHEARIEPFGGQEPPPRASRAL